MTDSERLDWYQAQHTLHKSLEVLYVVDGYELSLMAEDGETVLATYKGESLRGAIDQAMRSAQSEAGKSSGPALNRYTCLMHNYHGPTPCRWCPSKAPVVGTAEWLREWAREEARDG